MTRRASREKLPKVCFVKFADRPSVVVLETKFKREQRRRLAKLYANRVLVTSSDPAMIAVAKAALKGIEDDEKKSLAPARRKR